MLSSTRAFPDLPVSRRLLAAPYVRLACSHAVLFSALVGGQVHAELSDTVHPFASVVYSHDDNLLRLPDFAPGFEGSRADNIRQSQAGLLFERPLGRQVLTGQASISRVSFDHYSQLDYNGKDLNGAWEWHLANHLEGHVGGAYSQTLTPFTDYHEDRRNLRTQRRTYVDGTWTFHPRWRTHAGLTREKYNYDLLVQSYNDRVEDTRELGVDYLAPSGSRIGVVVRQIKGQYPNHRLIGSVAIDDGYTQDEAKLNLYWRLDELSQVQFLGGWVKRKHDFFVDRDSSGFNGRVTANWRPRQPLQLTFSGWREYSAVESSVVNSSLSKGASVRATWDVSAKFKADALLKRDKRDFSRENTVVLIGSAADDTRSSSLGVTYGPLPSVQVALRATRDTRSGSPLVGTGNYRSNGMSLSLYAQF